MKVQRLRITFTRGDEMKFVTHLDMMRFWERAIRRAGVPIAYSEGFTPHAQIQLAAPLPVGTTSDAELMDVFLAEAMTPRAFAERLAGELPPAVRITHTEQAGLTLPSLQAETRFAEYDVDVAVPTGFDVSAAIHAFLAAQTIAWEHKREDETKSYDIRALVAEIAVGGSLESDDGVRLRMRLRNDSSGSGRPEQVAAALGLPPPLRIHRTRITLAGTSPARDAWRNRGRFAG